MSEQTNVAFAMPKEDAPAWDLLARCVHCGLCLNHCPTYRTLGIEMDSPRGRIYQLVQVHDGKQKIDDSLALHIDRCLGCLACETACPSGVQYGRIIERARAQIETNYHRSLPERMLRRFFFARVLHNLSRLEFLARLVRFYQRSGIQTVFRKTRFLRLLGIADLDRLSPRIDSDFFFAEIGKTFPAVGDRRAKVAFLAGCISNVAFSHLNRATVKVLTENGIVVRIPDGQGCCGALDAHAGFREDARTLARKNISVFLSGNYDAILTNAAGCGSMMKEYDDLLAADSQFASLAHEFTAKVKDVTEYLAQVGLRSPKRQIRQNVIYQDACHLLHAQKIRSQPRELLKAIGCTLVEIPHADQCCGSAGVYNVIQNELSMRILDAKMDDISSVSADMLLTANVGCLIQLRAGVTERNMNLQVKHVLELLEEAYS